MTGSGTEPARLRRQKRREAMVSLKDIANECDVSVATVCKALNGYVDVSPDTKKRVFEAVEKLGYYPNATARTLKTKRSYNLGIVYKDMALRGLTHQYFSRVLEGFKGYAAERGYDITFTSGMHGERKLNALEHCQYRSVDGVLVVGVDFYDREIGDLVLSALPTVTIDHAFERCDAVLSDNADGMRQLLRYIIYLGHKKIAFIHGTASNVTESRVNTFYNIMAENGLDVPGSYVRECNYLNTEQAAAITGDLLGMINPPTCILYPDDYCCIGGIQKIRALGLMPGKDISVAGYDGSLIAETFTPRITTYRQDAEEIGRIAAEKLIERISHPHLLPERVYVKGRLVVGETIQDLRIEEAIRAQENA